MRGLVPEHLAEAMRRTDGGVLARPGGRSVGDRGRRDYSPGDDLLAIDWAVCARHDELWTRLAPGEADCRVDFLVDVSASMRLACPSKLDIARQLVARLGSLALARLDQVEVFAFTDAIVADSGPIRGRGGIALLSRVFDGAPSQPATTDLAAAAASLARRRRRAGIAMVLSDGFQPAGLGAAMAILREAGYHPRLLHLVDPRDADPGLGGDVALVDVETGRSWNVTLTERELAAYRRQFEAFLRSVEEDCRKYRVPYVRLPLELPVEDLLITALR